MLTESINSEIHGTISLPLRMMAQQVFQVQQLTQTLSMISFLQVMATTVFNNQRDNIGLLLVLQEEQHLQQIVKLKRNINSYYHLLFQSVKASLLRILLTLDILVTLIPIHSITINKENSKTFTLWKLPLENINSRIIGETIWVHNPQLIQRSNL